MFAGDDGTDGHHGLTDYELERVAHIRRNREIMRQLGLGFHDIVTAARARCGEEDGPSEPSEKRRKTDVRLTKTPRATETVEAGIERVLRRSRRLMENTDERRENTDDDPNAAIKKRSKYLADHEIDEVHERDAAAYALRNAVPSEVSAVGTAPYQHADARAPMSHRARQPDQGHRARERPRVVKMRLARVLFRRGTRGRRRRRRLRGSSMSWAIPARDPPGETRSERQPSMHTKIFNS